jgi:hypothetical protein
MKGTFLALKAFAAATLPTVRSHLKAIIAIATDMGIGV